MKKRKKPKETRPVKEKEMGFFPLLRATFPFVSRAIPVAFIISSLLAVVHGVSQALQTLVGQGVPVSDFHRAPMNLEKVFMEVTQDA